MSRRRLRRPRSSAVDASSGLRRCSPESSWVSSVTLKGTWSDCSRAQRKPSRPEEVGDREGSRTSMSKVKLNIAMSLDGYVAGPKQSQKDPLGIGGEQLHQWLIPLKAFRE